MHGPAPAAPRRAAPGRAARNGTLLLLALLAGSPGAARDAADTERSILLQSTTSTQNSGLLDYLLPRFTKDSGIEVRVVAVGSGQALKNARNGDSDTLFVHAPAAEEKFVAAGWGVERRAVMYNYFVLVGPAGDPAAIAGLGEVTAALRRIAARGGYFVSRGDDSGTHKRELALWRAAGLTPAQEGGTWYRETGSGMGATLNAAINMDAYTLTDRGTWINFRNKRDFRVLVQSDDRALFNQYSVILVNPERHPHVKARATRAFMDWLTGPLGQAEIAAYQLHGQQLFFPNARRAAGE